MPTRRTALSACACLLLGSSVLHASNPTQPWPEVRAALPEAALAGSARLRYLGLSVYDAQLWTLDGFRASQYTQQPFALTLNYLRTLKGAAIAARSVTEMQGIGRVDATQAASWGQAMTALFPDVRAGDRLTGLHQPGVGASFWLNGQPLGDINDAQFSERFFGIWLDKATSQPAMRRSLLVRAAP